MKISVINNFNINQAQKLSFQGKSYKKNKTDYHNDDICIADSNIVSVKTNPRHRLESVTFKTPLSPPKALLTLAYTKNEEISEALLYSLHLADELNEMAADLGSSNFLKNIKVNKLIGLGAFAIVFETTEGKVLKLTNGNHFPDGRKPDFFDLPHEKHERIGHTHYYIEEKVTQDDLTQEELKALVKEIKDKGYKMRDYLVNFISFFEESEIKKEQFGRTKDRKVYLIDPDCAIAPQEKHFDIKMLKNKIKKYFEKK